MRMNYKKRLWPMLALLPVFALAATLATGLLGPNPPAANAQAVPAVTATPNPTDVGEGKCGLVIPNTGTNIWGFGAVGDNVIAGGGCITSGDSVMVEVTNLDEDTSASTPEDPALLVAYVTGGDDIPTAQAGGAATPIGKLGLNEHRFALPIPTTDQFSGDAVNAKATIPVMRSMAKDGDVYVFLYNAAATGDIPIDRTATPPVLPPTNGYIKAIKVEFTGDAALKLAGTTNDASTLTVRGTGRTADATDSPLSPTTGQREVQVPSNGEVTATLNLEDVNGKPVNAQATLTVGGGAGVQFKDINSKTRILRGSATGAATAVIEGLPLTGALRIPLDATVGSLELPTYYITRSGAEAASVSVNAYVCTFDTSDDATDEENVDECMDEKEALSNTNTGDDPDALTVVAPGSFILLAGNAADAVGNKSQLLNLQWTAADADVLNGSAEDRPFAESTTTGATVNTPDFAHIQIADNATLGEYTIMVEDVGEDVTATEVDFTVTGDASRLAITGPDIINPATGLATYTVTATDRNGNVPTNVVDDPTTTAAFDGIRVSIIVRAAGSPTVTGLTADDTLDFASNGEATFTIVMPYGTRLGSPVTIVASGGALNATKEATYGTVAPALGPATGLTATSNATGTVMLSWTAGPGSTRHYVAGIRKSERDAGNYANVIFTAADSNSAHTVTGLTDGAVYLFTVISGNATTWSTWHDIIEVTVNPTAGGGGGPTNPFS